MNQKKKVTADAAGAQQDGQLAPVFDVSSLEIVMGMAPSLRTPTLPKSTIMRVYAMDCQTSVVQGQPLVQARKASEIWRMAHERLKRAEFKEMKRRVSLPKLSLGLHEHRLFDQSSPCGQWAKKSCWYPISLKKWIWSLLWKSPAATLCTTASPQR